MNILILGGGGREHALAWAASRSPDCDRLWCAPGNAGVARLATCVDLDPVKGDAVVEFCGANDIDFVIVGPEAPLAAGVASLLRARGIAAFGPSIEAAKLETSKIFTKDICEAVGAPTADYMAFDDPDQAKAFIRDKGAPIVIKADGLAAGKGVVVARTVAEAEAAADAMLGGKFGKAGAEIIVEDFLEGEEASLFALCDGDAILPFGAAQDYKRAHDGDDGPNTGGMGAYCPAPLLTPELQSRALKTIVEPVVREMKRRGAPYKGVLYAGLMLTAKGPQLIEFNVRFGDPECQALMMLAGPDLIDTLRATSEARLAEKTVVWRPGHAIVVVLAARGYPGDHATGEPIGGLDAAAEDPEVQIFHAGTVERDGRLLSNGGRVLNVAATGATLAEARQRAYAAAAKIDWPGGFHRTDIGLRGLET